MLSFNLKCTAAVRGRRTEEVNLVDRANLKGHGVGVWELVLVEICEVDRVDEAAWVEVDSWVIRLTPADRLQISHSESAAALTRLNSLTVSKAELIASIDIGHSGVCDLD